MYNDASLAKQGSVAGPKVPEYHTGKTLGLCIVCCVIACWLFFFLLVSL